MTCEVNTTTTTSTSFLFPTTIQCGMLFESRNDILAFVNKEAIGRGLPVHMYSFGNTSSQGLRLLCKLCSSALNFRKLGDLWIATTFNPEHHHSRIPTKSTGLHLRKEEIAEMSFVFPTSVERGMLFKDAQDVRTQIEKEAIEKALPMNIYRYSPYNSFIKLICKICMSRLNFRKMEKGFEATTLNNQHIHGKEQIAGYEERRKQTAENQRLRKRTRVKSQFKAESARLVDSAKEQEVKAEQLA